MRIFFAILIFISNAGLNAQTETVFKIQGHVIDKRTDFPVSRAVVYLKTNQRQSFETFTDSSGKYVLNNISGINTRCIIAVNHDRYFGSTALVTFDSITRDTIIDIYLEPIPYDPDWFPEVYFIYNTSIPLDSSVHSIHAMAEILFSNPTIKATLTGYRDSLETIDLRLERAEFVYNELIKLGIEKERLSTKAGSKPNILKYTTYYKNPVTKDIDFIELNEVYISNYPVEEQVVLRQYNRSVGFTINF